MALLSVWPPLLYAGDPFSIRIMSEKMCGDSHMPQDIYTVRKNDCFTFQRTNDPNAPSGGRARRIYLFCICIVYLSLKISSVRNGKLS